MLQIFELAIERSAFRFARGRRNFSQDALNIYAESPTSESKQRHPRKQLYVYRKRLLRQQFSFISKQAIASAETYYHYHRRTHAELIIF